MGCKIRFRDRTASETLIKLVTDGLLLSEIRGDPDLLEYDTVILDEAHERSLNIDFLLGYLRLLLKRRPGLKLVITSATIDVEKFSRVFGGAPVVEISGRMYPVEVRYQPLEEVLGEAEELSYTDAAVAAVEQLLDESALGDALVFMPGERDIRETSDLLQHRLAKRNVEILPLFSRLTAAEQQRVFSRPDRRRVVVATNIAETSLTIPGIRYVVDPGLARINRYNPRTHTQRLPVEAISRSSAEQRKGRCGRVAEGVCVRLYSEEEFLSRPEYTAPEIQRSDLADIILRMLDLQLGKVEEFPFVDPPSPRAINSGYDQLQELGALDSRRRLTRLGRDMARLPIAPTVSRMILQARAEGALPELLVIASAIGIQDPRERPLDRRDEADRMHRQFVDRHSDFLTLLNIWNRYHERFEQLETQSQMRRFCRRHFLSFTRMREWRDIYAQLTGVLSDLGGFRLDPGRRRAGYDAIHRSIATGLLSSIARKKEHNLYRAARNREVMLFPGSGLFERRGEAAAKDQWEALKSGASPEWIVAAEIVETSRLFRTHRRPHPGWLAARPRRPPLPQFIRRTLLEPQGRARPRAGNRAYPRPAGRQTPRPRPTGEAAGRPRRSSSAMPWSPETSTPLASFSRATASWQTASRPGRPERAAPPSTSTRRFAVFTSRVSKRTSLPFTTSTASSTNTRTETGFSTCRRGTSLMARHPSTGTRFPTRSRSPARQSSSPTLTSRAVKKTASPSGFHTG